MTGKTELSIGVFMAAGIVCLAYLSINLGGVNLPGGARTFEVTADFANVGGLKAGAEVAIAGVAVGLVRDVRLNQYQARIVMTISEPVELYEDAIASIKTRGLIGEKYVGLSPGGGVDERIPPGGHIRETQPAIDIEEMISKLVFEGI